MSMQLYVEYLEIVRPAVRCVELLYFQSLIFIHHVPISNVSLIDQLRGVHRSCRS